MQNDFIDGALGSAEAVAILPYVKELVKSFDGIVYFTRDTHFENYMSIEEGKHLPVPHCIKDTEGWQIHPELEALRTTPAIDKLTFGSKELIALLADKQGIESITLCGLCTDICVISNALLIKAYYPEIPLFVVANACAGVTPESHQNALDAMKMCQVEIV
jgi:nicotinamidase-related amidase